MLPIQVQARINKICSETGFLPDNPLIELTDYGLTHCSGCYRKVSCGLDFACTVFDTLPYDLLNIDCATVPDIDSTLKGSDIVDYAAYWVRKCGAPCEWLHVCIDLAIMDFDYLNGTHHTNLTLPDKQAFNLKEQTVTAKRKPIVKNVASKLIRCAHCTKIKSCVLTQLTKYHLTQERIVSAAVNHLQHKCAEIQ